MSTDLLREPPQRTPTASLRSVDWPVDVPSFGSAVRALLEDARVGRVGVATPEDRWLVPRIEEALSGFDDIQQMDTGYEPVPPSNAGAAAATASILARRARALG